MMQLVKARMLLLVIVLLFFGVGYTYAHNKVAVIPLGGDTVPEGTISGRQIVKSAPLSISGYVGHGGSVACPLGKVPIGGGFVQTNSAGSPITVSPPSIAPKFTGSYPSGHYWQVLLVNPISSTQYYRVYAVCVTES